MPSNPPEAEYVVDHAIRYKMLLGFAFCAVYAAAYVGFVAITVYDVTLMDTEMPLGVNLGVFYGFGLILLAFALSLAYNFACTLREKATTAAHAKAAESPVSAKGGGDK
jgi:uncharacterized membrane protein (DUF485 family)